MSAPGQRIRLFIGIRLPESVHERMLGVGSRLTSIAGVRLVPPEKLHLTLRFIGAVEESAIPPLTEALKTVSQPQAELMLQGVMRLPATGTTRVLACGVETSPWLVDLHRGVSEASSAWGAPDPRPYKPHVTVARTNNPPSDALRAWLEDWRGVRIGPIPVPTFKLIHSHPSDGYKDLASFPLRTD